MDKEIFSKLFISYIQPRLENASQVWSLHLQKHKELIEKVQRRAAEMVPELRELS